MEEVSDALEQGARSARDRLSLAVNVRPEILKILIRGLGLDDDSPEISKGISDSLFDKIILCRL